MSDPTALFAYGIDLGDGSGYYLSRRDVFDEIDDLYEERNGQTPPELSDGLADFLRDRLAGFNEPEPDFGDNPADWSAWSKRRTAAHDALMVDLIRHGDDTDTTLILAAKPTFRTDWNRPIPVEISPQTGLLHLAVASAMVTLGIESSERPGWLLAAYGD